MLHDKRRHKRLNVFIVVEIKSLNAPAKYHLGIIKNFSFEGFSFESQSEDLEVGENIEFKLRHPNDSSYVLNSGNIVWKKRDGEFDFFMGVKFREVDEAAKQKLLEIASLAGNVPIDSFLSENCDKDIPVEEIGEHELLVDEAEAAEHLEEAVPVQDELFEQDMEEADEPDVQEDIAQVEYAAADRIKQVPKRNLWLYPFLAIAIVVALFMILEGLNPPVKEKAPVPSRSINEEIVQEAPVPAVIYPHPLDKGYSIQVGAWKYPEYAHAMLIKVQSYYPEAYIMVENDFHKIRIPDIPNKEIGADVSKDIEGKFKIKPILIQKKVK